MKICDMVQAYAATSGGVKTYVDAKQRFLLEQGVHEHVLIVPGSVDRLTDLGRARIYEVSSPLVSPRLAYRFIRRVDKLLKILEHEAPTVVEVGDPYLMPWIARYRRWRRGTPCVGFYHTDFPRAYARQYVQRQCGRVAGGLAERIADRYVAAVYRGCDAVVASTPASFAQLARLKLPNLLELPLGVDLDLFSPRRADRAVWKARGIDPHRPVVIYAGRLDSEKRTELLVGSFLALPATTDAQLVLVGEGPLRASLLARAAAEPRLHVLPYEHDRAELARLLASAELYVTAGPHETFALSVIEAQACGLPVVGVAAGALVDRVTPADGLLAEPDAPASLTATLDQALRADLGALGRAARARVEQQFSWRTTFMRLLALYEGIAQDPGSRTDRTPLAALKGSGP